MSAFDPDFRPALVRPSPNFNERRGGRDGAARQPDILLLHYTAMQSAREAIEWLASEESQVSCHYLVDEGGIVTQLVPESQRAWHAGQSFWKGDTDINSASIGIEIANPGHDFGSPPYPGSQMVAVIRLCRDILSRHAIAPERVLAHSDVAPERKRDPGEWFPWGTLFEKGIGHWVEPAPVSGGRFFGEGDGGPPVEALQTMLSLYGYDCETDGSYGRKTAAAVRAFQRHFRPGRVDGIADVSTITTLHRLLSALPAIS